MEDSGWTSTRQLLLSRCTIEMFILHGHVRSKTSSAKSKNCFKKDPEACRAEVNVKTLPDTLLSTPRAELLVTDPLSRIPWKAKLCGEQNALRNCNERNSPLSRTPMPALPSARPLRKMLMTCRAHVGIIAMAPKLRHQGKLSLPRS